MRTYYILTISYSGAEMFFEFGDFSDAAEFGELAVEARNIRVARLLSDKHRIIHEFRNRVPVLPEPVVHTSPAIVMGAGNHASGEF